MDLDFYQIYLYLALLIGLVLIVIGSIGLIELGLRTFVFTEADKPLLYPIPPKIEGISEETLLQNTQEYIKAQLEFERANLKRERERKLSFSLSLLIVGISVFLFHWKLAREKDKLKS